MGKKSKRSAQEAGLVAVEAEGTSADAVGLPTADVAELDAPPAKKKKKSKKPSDEGADNAATTTTKSSTKSSSSKSKERERELEVPADALSPIAHPLAGRKLSKKVLKTVKKASRNREIRRGVKEVSKAAKKGEKGLIVLAGDASPMDVISHFPILAEEAGCPYVYVTSKALLGQASSTKRPTAVVMISPGSNRKPRKTATGETKQPEDYKEAYAECIKEVEELDRKIDY